MAETSAPVTPLVSSMPPPPRRCAETRAHYPHPVGYGPLAVQCPGGPTEIDLSPLKRLVEHFQASGDDQNGERAAAYYNAADLLRDTLKGLTGE